MKYLVNQDFTGVGARLRSGAIMEFTEERANRINGARPGTLLPYAGPVKVPFKPIPVKSKRGKRAHD